MFGLRISGINGNLYALNFESDPARRIVNINSNIEVTRAIKFFICCYELTLDSDSNSIYFVT